MVNTALSSKQIKFSAAEIKYPNQNNLKKLFHICFLICLLPKKTGTYLRILTKSFRKNWRCWIVDEESTLTFYSNEITFPILVKCKSDKYNIQTCDLYFWVMISARNVRLLLQNRARLLTCCYYGKDAPVKTLQAPSNVIIDHESKFGSLANATTLELNKDQIIIENQNLWSSNLK